MTRANHNQTAATLGDLPGVAMPLDNDLKIRYIYSMDIKIYLDISKD